MPPKKKPAATPTATPSATNTATVVPTPATPATTTTTTTSSTNGNGNNNNSNSSSQSTPTNGSSNVGQKKIQWYWTGDSGKKGKSQDVLVEYDSKMNTDIELQYQSHLLKPKTLKLQKFKVDNERYIDFKKMEQTRYDDVSKVRSVERQEIVIGASPPSKPSTKQSAKRKALVSKKRKLKVDSDSDASDSYSSDSSSSSESEKSDESDSSDDSDSDNEEDYIGKWYWAGDSNGGPSNGGGHQDIWIAYDLKFCKKLEKALAANEMKVKVDNDRFIDLQNMLQRRYDDEQKRRNIKRDDPKKTKAKIPAAKKKLKVLTGPTTTTLPSISNIISPTTSTTTTTTTSGSLSGNQMMINLLKCPNTWTDMDSMDYKEIDVASGEKEFKWMQDLFNNTISSNHKGVSTLSPIIFNQLKVTRLTRVQNPSLWIRYHNRKQKILDDAKGNCPKVKMVLTDLPNGPEVDVKSNEFFLFHGLNISSVTGIAKFGFDPRFCSLEGMFGAGLYFAENSSKSNQYCHAGACTCSGFLATSCRCSASDEMCLLVCRVVLGDSLIENVFRGNSPGNFWHNKRTEPKKPDGVSIYNSVVGESKANYGSKASLQLREYIVYESSQVYVEYKVYFKRIK